MLANESFGAPKEHTTTILLKAKKYSARCKTVTTFDKSLSIMLGTVYNVKVMTFVRNIKNSPHKIFLVSLILIVRIMFLVKTTNQGL